MDTIRFTLDGELVEIRDLPPTTTLLDWLRARGKTGTKEGCAEGDCGACTVAMLDTEVPGGARWRSINSCLVLLPMLHGRDVVTVQGIGRPGALHPVQDAMVRHLGSQCGYCTPGVVMTMFEACYRDDLRDDWQLDDQMCGTLCRCTGYRPIRDAAAEVAGSRPDDAWRAAEEPPPVPLDDDGHPLPVATRGLAYQHQGQRFFLPDSYDALFDAIEQNTDAKLISGATDLGLDVTKKHVKFPCLVSTEAVPGLRRLDVGDDGAIVVGGAVSLSALEAAAQTACPPLARMLRYFGARQIKNRGTVGGNLCNASPIGDLAPVLLALGATVVARSRSGERRIPIDTFFVAYRKTALNAGEILDRVEIPPIPADARVSAYKVSKRRELDISAVAAGFYVRVDADGAVTEARLAFGGMAATPKRSAKAEAALVGEPWTRAAVDAAAAALAEEFTPLDDHRGSSWYRSTVAANLLQGFLEETLSARQPALKPGHSGTVEVR